MKWASVLPVGRPTLDRRVINGLLLERPWPLPLMIEGASGRVEYRLGAHPVGQINHATVARHRLWVGGTMWTPGSRPAGGSDVPLSAFLEHDWYAVPDLTDILGQTYHSWFRQYFQINGTLAGMTLVSRPSWRHQQPVSFTP